MFHAFSLLFTTFAFAGVLKQKFIEIYFVFFTACSNFASTNSHYTIMRIKFIAIILLGLLCDVTSVSAQSRHSQSLSSSRRHAAQAQPDMVTLYMDSLLHFRAHQDSAHLEEFVPTMTVPALPKLGIEYKLLFMPTTFYKGVSHNFFDIDRDANLIDESLLALYLGRPDLVRSTQSQLERAGDIRKAEAIHVDHAPEIVEKVAPKPQETVVAPLDIVVLKPNFWTYSGDYYLQFLQNYISSNWYKGGESNYSMVGSITLNANYNNKQKVRWDNKLEMKLGFQTSRQDTLHTMRVSENLLRLTSKLGLQASRSWYYTIQMIAATQFVRQWNSNSNVVTTDFLGPLNVNLSVGMDYNVKCLKDRLTGSIHLAPLAYNFRYVNRLELASRYGLDEGEHQLHNFGSQFTVDLLWKFADNIRWKTRLYGYTTYERAELEWENTFTFQFNKYISSNIFVYPRFDDGTKRSDRHGYYQLKEYASLGFAYSF